MAPLSRLRLAAAPLLAAAAGLALMASPAGAVTVDYSYEAEDGQSWTGVFDVDNLAALVSDDANYNFITASGSSGQLSSINLTLFDSDLFWDESGTSNTYFQVFSRVLSSAVSGGADWNTLIATGSYPVEADGAFFTNQGNGGSALEGFGGTISFRSGNGDAVPGPVPLLGAAAAFRASRRLKRRLGERPTAG